MVYTLIGNAIINPITILFNTIKLEIQSATRTTIFNW